MKKEVLSLIGCGWLGKSLAIDLHNEGRDIIACTASDRSEEFALSGIPYTFFDVANSTAPESVVHSDTVIYMVPPLGVSHVKKFFDQLSVSTKVIFISSTSVYGKNLSLVNEETQLQLCSTGSPLLLETENYMRNRFHNLTILRLGGLYGHKRHPVFFLQGKDEVKGAHEYLHLAHHDECVKAIKSVLEKNIWHEIFNIVGDIKYRKKEYYEAMADKLNLPRPVYYYYESSMRETLVSNEKSRKMLMMEYRDPNEFCTYSG